MFFAIHTGKACKPVALRTRSTQLACPAHIAGVHSGVAESVLDCSHNLQMARFFCVDVDQQIFPRRILAVSPWIEYCIAAANSTFAPPNCSSSMLPNRGSGCTTHTGTLVS